MAQAGGAAHEDRVNLESDVPLTDQLEAILRRRIIVGTLIGKLPSESQLMEEHQVSRVTVRRALERLEKAGLVFGAKGRGWFVKRAEQKQSPPQKEG